MFNYSSDKSYYFQEFEVHQIELNMLSSSQSYHFKVRMKSGGTRRTMFEISNDKFSCGVDFDDEIRLIIIIPNSA